MDKFNEIENYKMTMLELEISKYLIYCLRYNKLATLNR